MANYQEFETIAAKLEKWHGLFYQFWSLGVPVFTEKIQTAAVAFNKKGQFVQFMFNPKFWDGLNEYEREFIICHECLHVLYEHGIRMKSTTQPKMANIAMDVVVNHSMVNNFGFDRSKLSSIMQEADASKDIEEKTLDEVLVWKESTFPEPDKIKDNETFEYYYSKIEQLVEDMIANGQISKDGSGIPVNMPGSGGPLDQDSIDDHSFMEGQGQGDEESDMDDDNLGQIPKGVMEDLVDEVRESLNADENKSMTDAGIGRGDKLHKVRAKARKVKQKWEKLVQLWTASGDTENDCWTTKSRRHAMLSDHFMLPHDDEIDSDKAKVNVWFFQDTSGSCVDFADDFFNAARTFPKHHFKLRMFCFDTRTYEIDPDNPTLKGFGGTAFGPIEEAIQSKMRTTKCSYPDAVFVFTDGAGTSVSPRHPDRWHWFLEGHYQQKSYIPKKSKTYQLSDFVE